MKNEAFFTYSIEDGINYSDLLSSVECIENPIVSSVNDDHIKLCNKAHELIAQRINQKTELINQLYSAFKPCVSKSKITQLIESKEGIEWSMDKGKNNTHIYSSISPRLETPLAL